MSQTLALYLTSIKAADLEEKNRESYSSLSVTFYQLNLMQSSVNSA